MMPGTIMPREPSPEEIERMEAEMKKAEDEMRQMMAPIQAAMPQAVYDQMKMAKLQAMIVILNPDGTTECLPAQLRSGPPPMPRPRANKQGPAFMPDMDEDMFQNMVNEYNKGIEEADSEEKSKKGA